MWGCFLMSGVKILHFLKDWWKSIPIHQNYTMALMILHKRGSRMINCIELNLAYPLFKKNIDALDSNIWVNLWKHHTVSTNGGSLCP